MVSGFGSCCASVDNGGSFDIYRTWTVPQTSQECQSPHWGGTGNRIYAETGIFFAEMDERQVKNRMFCSAQWALFLFIKNSELAMGSYPDNEIKNYL